MTFLHISAINAWLLIYPCKLSYDWSMDRVGLVTSVTDYRNIYSIVALCMLVGGLVSMIRQHGSVSISTVNIYIHLNYTVFYVIQFQVMTVNGFCMRHSYVTSAYQIYSIPPVTRYRSVVYQYNFFDSPPPAIRIIRQN